MKILFVCTGNTCRSPMAEGLFNRMAADAGKKEVAAESAGLFAAEGEPASPNAVMAVGESGADISCHRARQLTGRMAEEADEIFTMSPAHRQALLERFPQARGKVSVLGGGIPDPFGGDLAVYRRCRDEILRALKPVAERYLRRDG